MPSITIRRDGRPAKTVELEKGLTLIGRKADADILIDQPEAAEEHASILRIGEEFVLGDLDPALATLVNGQPATKRALRDRDLITIGEYRMTYHDEREADRPLGVEAELAGLQGQSGMPPQAATRGDALGAPPSKTAERITYAVICALVLGAAYWGYASYVAREAAEAQLRAAAAQAEAQRQQAVRQQQESRDITSLLKQGAPAAPTPGTEPGR